MTNKQRFAKQRFGYILPTIPCSEDIRKRVEQEATKRNVPLVQVVRDALVFYFSSDISKAKEKLAKLTSREQPHDEQ